MARIRKLGRTATIAKSIAHGRESSGRVEAGLGAPVVSVYRTASAGRDIVAALFSGVLLAFAVRRQNWRPCGRQSSVPIERAVTSGSVGDLLELAVFHLVIQILQVGQVAIRRQAAAVGQRM